MTAPPPPPSKAGGGMSLYANLLNPKAADASTSPAASITGAPVSYDGGDKDDASRREAIPAMRFQPIIRRPQVNQKKPPKPGFPKAIPQQPTPPPPTTAASAGDGSKDATAATAATQPSDLAPQAQRTTLADWTATEDDEYLWGTGEKRQRGGRKAARKRKKNAQDGGGGRQRETDWDEIYDPARPTNVDEYLRSEERIREVQEWKGVLYAHRRRRKGSYDETSEEEEEDGERGRMGLGNQFAPPAEYSFAPPPMSPPAPPRDPPVPVPDDATGDDAYARRLALSGMAPPPPTDTPTPPPPPPPPEQPGQDGATITRGPVRYEAPPQPSPAPHDAMDVDDDGDDGDDNIQNIDLPPAPGLGTPDAEGEAPRTNRPGQKGFAQRLMSKYGWTAGTGLGASSSGIINPLSVKVEKRKRRPDAEGGGFAEPGGRGTIVGGKTANDGPGESGGAGSSGKFGTMSEVVVLQNMLEGMDNLEGEISDGLGQEIGEECGDKYGRVERLYIDVGGRQVFIKFTDAVSALRAVNALEGRVFNGNAIAARFWDAEKFERGVYT